MGRKQGVCQLPSEALQPKLDGEDVNSEDCDTNPLVKMWGEIMVERTKRQEAAKESKADGCGEEAETEEEADAEPHRVAKCYKD